MKIQLEGRDLVFRFPVVAAGPRLLCADTIIGKSRYESTFELSDDATPAEIISIMQDVVAVFVNTIAEAADLEGPA